MPTAPFSGPVLVTGCSTGIGRATVSRLLDAGLPVVASARRPETLTDLAGRGAGVVRLDVTDVDSRRTAVAEVVDRHGGLGALVNNAGYGLIGPVEMLSVDDIRRQFETNVVGLIATTQEALPHLRAAGGGRLVNVGSMGGQVTFPGAGVYHATKYAVEALSDALRLELRPFGIGVTVIEPAGVATEFEATGNRTLVEDLDSPYADFLTRYRSVAARMQAPDAPGMLTADHVARRIVGALLARRAPARIKVGAVAKVTTTSRRLTPDRIWDASVARVFGLT